MVLRWRASRPRAPLKLIYQTYIKTDFYGGPFWSKSVLITVPKVNFFCQYITYHGPVVNFCDHNTILFLACCWLFLAAWIIFLLSAVIFFCVKSYEKIFHSYHELFFQWYCEFFFTWSVKNCFFINCADNYFSRCNLFIFFDLQYIAGLWLTGTGFSAFTMAVIPDF